MSENPEKEVASSASKTSGTKPPNVDLLQHITGAFGKYQLRIFLLICLTKAPIAIHQMAIIFLAPKVKFTCPPTNAETCPCPNPQYDTSVFTETIIMKWHLICGRKSLASFNQLFFQFGSVIGSIFFGMASDRYGRKKPLLVSVVIQVTTGIAAAFIPEYWTFTFFRFLVGVSVGGTMVIGFVIVMEFVGTQYRDIIAALYQVPFNLGQIMLPAFGYFFRNYSDFQLAISIPTAIMLIYFCLVPETPRWLLAMKRTDEAIKILERIAKTNNRPTDIIRPDVEAFQLAAEKHHLKKGNILDLFRTPNIRKNIIIMSWDWLTCGYCFYGIAQYVGHLSGNVFVNVATGSTFCLLGTLASIPVLRILGRKQIIIIFNLICAICLLILAVLPDGLFSVICAIVGEVASFVVFVVVYLYCGELFPTVVRNAAVGVSSMMARAGSMIAPFIVGLQTYALWAPPLAFAIVPIIAVILTFMLPETKGCVLMTTIEEGEEFGKKVRSNERPVEIDKK